MKEKKTSKIASRLKRYQPKLIEPKYKVDTSGIAAGDTYDTYAALTAALKEKIKTSNSKVAQIKRWERYFAYHREGRRWIIDKIYTSPIGERSKNAYGEDLYFILRYFALKGRGYNTNEEYTIEYSKRQLYVLTGLIGEEFKKDSWKVMIDEKTSLVKKEFFREVRSYTDKMFERALTSLVKTKGLKYKYNMILVTEDKKFIRAEEAEMKRIFKIEERAAEIFDVKSEYTTSTGEKYKNYKSFVKQELRELGCKLYYNTVEIVIPQSDVKSLAKIPSPELANLERCAFENIADKAKRGIERVLKNCANRHKERIGEEAAERYKTCFKKYSKKYIEPVKRNYDNIYKGWELQYEV